MTFLPDGEPPIPKQGGVPSIPAGRPSADRPNTYLSSSYGSPQPVDSEARDVARRVLLRTGAINIALLVAAVLAGYVFPISDDPQTGYYLLLGAVAFSALHTLLATRSTRKRLEQQIAEKRAAQAAMPGDEPQDRAGS